MQTDGLMYGRVLALVREQPWAILPAKSSTSAMKRAVTSGPQLHHRQVAEQCLMLSDMDLDIVYSNMQKMESALNYVFT